MLIIEEPLVKKNKNKGHPGSYSLLLVHFIMFYRSIGSGLGIGRYSKSNDSDSDSGAKKRDRDVPSEHTEL